MNIVREDCYIYGVILEKHVTIVESAVTHLSNGSVVVHDI